MVVVRLGSVGGVYQRRGSIRNVEMDDSLRQLSKFQFLSIATVIVDSDNHDYDDELLIFVQAMQGLLKSRGN